MLDTNDCVWIDYFKVIVTLHIRISYVFLCTGSGVWTYVTLSECVCPVSNKICSHLPQLANTPLSMIISLGFSIPCDP